MILQNWWLTQLLGADVPLCAPLSERTTCDVLVIGGGVAGLHAALRLVNAGKKVVLLEKSMCGGSSSGLSSGFITPDSELELSQLIRRYGKKDARTVWNMAVTGVELIRESIKRYDIECDMQDQDSLFLGIGSKGIESVEEEAHARKLLGYDYKEYTKKQLSAVNKGEGYSAGIRYSGSFSIISLLYAQGLKRVLLSKGVRVYEDTEVVSLERTHATTHLGSVSAKEVIVCIDKMKTAFNKAARGAYHAQTFLAVSEPLSAADIKSIFPQKPMMCWDSKLVYTYYRLTGDKRLLVGGGSPLATYWPTPLNSSWAINQVIREIKRRFPKIDHVAFTHYWPGLIDISKDLMPIVDYDGKHVQYVLGCPGLPWAAFSGDYAARRLIDSHCPDYTRFLKGKRDFFISDALQPYLGKIVSFALNNLYAKYEQKDTR